MFPAYAIANERVNRIYQALHPYAGVSRAGRLPQIDVATGDNDDALLLFHYVGERPDEIVAWLEKSIPGRAPVTGVFLQVGRKATMRKVWGDARVSYTFPATCFRISRDDTLFPLRRFFPGKLSAEPCID